MVPGQLAAVFLVCAVAAATAAAAAKLPSWLVLCYRDDPKFNECATRNGIKAIPTLVLGDKKLRIPVLDPMRVTELRVDKEATQLGVGLVMKDITLTGPSLTQLREYRVDFLKKRIEYEIFLPRLEILSTYNISGQILLLPITGYGPSNITAENVLISYGLDYDLEKREDGKDYMVLKKGKLDFNCTRAHIFFGNLFNGNKLLGENMNSFLNENWMGLIREVGPAIAEALGEAVRSVFSYLASVIPFDDIHPLRPT